jgi:hypothetical protein
MLRSADGESITRESISLEAISCPSFAGASEHGERATRTERAGEAARREIVCGCPQKDITADEAVRRPATRHGLAARRQERRDERFAPSVDRAIYNVAWLVPNGDAAAAVLKSRGVHGL